MTKRNDAHRPSAINPAEYEFVACDYYGSKLEGEGFLMDRQAFQAHMKATGAKYAEQENNGTCYICGARALYVAKYHHLPTNSYIVTGMDCAEKLGIGEPGAFKTFRKRIKEGMELGRRHRRAEVTLGEHGLADAWTVWMAGTQSKDRPAREESTIIDIVGKLIRYKDISPGQINYLRSLLARIANRPVVEAQRAAEHAAAQPVPQTDARVKVVGKIVSTKMVDGMYGVVTKMLVQTDAGYKVFGTVPAHFMNEVSKTGEHCLRGFRVEFEARLERSNNDEKFGFFSRPTKPAILERAPVRDIGDTGRSTYSGENLPSYNTGAP